MNHTEAAQYIIATLTAFGPGEAISMTKETWANIHEAMQVLAQPEQEAVAECVDDGEGGIYYRTIKKHIGLLYTAPPQPEQEPVVQWHLSKDGLPPVGSEVVGGYFYKDTWLKGEPEVFAWGQCRVIKDDHPDFPDGKRWITFGPSHNQITYWCWPPKKPGDTSPPQRTWVGLTGFEQKELMAMSARDAVFATEDKLRRKNT